MKLHISVQRIAAGDYWGIVHTGNPMYMVAAIRAGTFKRARRAAQKKAEEILSRELTPETQTENTQQMTAALETPNALAEAAAVLERGERKAEQQESFEKAWL